MKPEHAIQTRASAATPEVWIVILTWNNYSDTQECLASLAKLTYTAYRVVVVDNGSDDGTPSLVRAHYPDAIVIENGRNLGVPAGYNVGFRYALQRGAALLLMLNNDTVVDPALLDALVVAAQAPNAGILMPIVYYYDDPAKIWSAGARYRWLPPMYVGEKTIHHATHYYELEYAIACCILITAAAAQQVGLLDETYFFMWEDLDWSQRMRDAGFSVLQVPDAHLWHKVSRTTRPGSALFWRMHGESGAIFHRKHSRWPLAALVCNLGYFALRELIAKRRWKFLRAFVQGLQTGWSRPIQRAAIADM